jgi:hypothetical protein
LAIFHKSEQLRTGSRKSAGSNPQVKPTLVAQQGLCLGRVQSRQSGLGFEIRQEQVMIETVERIEPCAIGKETPAEETQIRTAGIAFSLQAPKVAKQFRAVPHQTNGRQQSHYDRAPLALGM